MSTINGKTLAEVFTELREVKGTTRDKDMGRKSYDYYPIEEYVRAFNKVVGAEHYNIDYSELQYVRIASGQDMLTCKCTITLLDDDGQPVLHKDGYGGDDFSYNKEGGKDGNLKNLPHNATTNAFKSAVKWFGIFGTYAEEKGSKGNTSGTSSSKSDNKQAAGNKASKSDIRIALHTKDAFFKGGTETRTGKDIWKVRATLDSDNSECEVIFYPNQYEKDERTFGLLQEKCAAKSVEMRITATACGEREGIKQFVFKDYLPKKAA